MRDVIFTCQSYDELQLDSESLIYCDIPYRGTKWFSGTKKFNHDDFYSWAKNAKAVGHTVLISEYAEGVPEGFEVVWQVESQKLMKNSAGIRVETVEVLMQSR